MEYVIHSYQRLVDCALDAVGRGQTAPEGSAVVTYLSGRRMRHSYTAILRAAARWFQDRSISLRLVTGGLGTGADGQLVEVTQVRNEFRYRVSNVIHELERAQREVAQLGQRERWLRTEHIPALQRRIVDHRPVTVVALMDAIATVPGVTRVYDGLSRALTSADKRRLGLTPGSDPVTGETRFAVETLPLWIKSGSRIRSARNQLHALSTPLTLTFDERGHIASGRRDRHPHFGLGGACLGNGQRVFSQLMESGQYIDAMYLLFGQIRLGYSPGGELHADWKHETWKHWEAAMPQDGRKRQAWADTTMVQVARTGEIVSLSALIPAEQFPKWCRAGREYGFISQTDVDTHARRREQQDFLISVALHEFLDNAISVAATVGVSMEFGRAISPAMSRWGVPNCGGNGCSCSPCPCGRGVNVMDIPYCRCVCTQCVLRRLMYDLAVMTAERLGPPNTLGLCYYMDMTGGRRVRCRRPRYSRHSYTCGQHRVRCTCCSVEVADPLRSVTLCNNCAEMGCHHNAPACGVEVAEEVNLQVNRDVEDTIRHDEQAPEVSPGGVEVILSGAHLTGDSIDSTPRDWTE